MSGSGVLREVWDDLRDELVRRRLQVVAALGYVVQAAGTLYLFSSVGEDSGTIADVHRRTTLAAVGTGLLAVGSLWCLVTLLLDRAARRRPVPVPAHHLPDRRRLVVGAAGGTALVALGVVALLRWS